MSRTLWMRFVGVSILFAVLLSFLYVFLIRETTGGSSRGLQRGIYLFIARIVESDDYRTSLQRIDAYRSESKALPLQLWVLSASGVILARNTPAEPPVAWQRAARPPRVHDIVTYARFLPALPEFAVVRLQAPLPTYLIVQDAWVASRRILILQSVIFLATLVGAIFLGLSLVTLYLRVRSKEVKRVITAMKSGELSARFRLGRLDELGRIMLDFNDMANEIEHLVTRLRATERGRRELLQELGHDLRTPLTSLRTSAETLLAHSHHMPPQDQSEFVKVIKGELDYLQRLIENLFFIAEMAEPRYTRDNGKIDLFAAVNAEVLAVSALGDGPASRSVAITLEPCQLHVERRFILGDAHLIGRLFRNAIENAAHYATSSVLIEITRTAGALQVLVDDDGPGMSPEAMASFGRRRAQRILPIGGNTFASLGLGAVIIQSVLSSHGGQLKIQSSHAGDAVRGTRLTFLFPASEEESLPTPSTSEQLDWDTSHPSLAQLPRRRGKPSGTAA